MESTWPSCVARLCTFQSEAQSFLFLSSLGDGPWTLLLGKISVLQGCSILMLPLPPCLVPLIWFVSFLCHARRSDPDCTLRWTSDIWLSPQSTARRPALEPLAKAGSSELVIPEVPQVPLEPGQKARETAC